MVKRKSDLARVLPRAAARSWGLVFTMLGMGFPCLQAAGQQPLESIDLTLERMVELALTSSYQVRFLDMSVEQTRQGLRAERARLRSSVSMDISAPDFQSISATQYNSVLGRNQVVRENSRRWEAQISVRQPVILFGYPTNGYLSLNNRVYRYTQIEEDGGADLTYYNRYFIRYTQPLFQPNGLKNSLEQAELNLEDAELDYYDDVIGIIDDVSDDYYDLFETAYEGVIYSAYVQNLERSVEVAQGLAAADASRSIELSQINVELANARELVQRASSDFRLQTAQMRTRLNLAESVPIELQPQIELRPIPVDLEEATRLAVALTPRLRQLDIQYRENEIRLDETRGRNAFRVDLEFTYGREMRDAVLERLWGEPSNTYTIDVNAYIPLWDWGERDARVQSSRLNLDRTGLQIEQAQVQIVSNVQNEVRNVEELGDRALTMEQNLSLAASISEESIERYGAGTITALDLLQSLRREVDTANNFLDAYLGWRQSLLRLQELTFYDFEAGMPVIDRYGISL